MCACGRVLMKRAFRVMKLKFEGQKSLKKQALRNQTYPGLKLMSHFSKCHILLNAIHAILKLHSGHIYIGNHRTDITCVSERKRKIEMKGAIETNFVTNIETLNIFIM